MRLRLLLIFCGVSCFVAHGSAKFTRPAAQSLTCRRRRRRRRRLRRCGRMNAMLFVTCCCARCACCPAVFATLTSPCGVAQCGDGPFEGVGGAAQCGSRGAAARGRSPRGPPASPCTAPRRKGREGGRWINRSISDQGERVNS